MPRSAFIFVKELGKGSFGVVFQVQRKCDAVNYVCKQINLRGKDIKMQTEAKEEVTLLKRVSRGCKFIVQYVESFLEDQQLHIIMELCSLGDLDAFLKTRDGRRLEEPMCWKFVVQVAKGISWLHLNRILHRDIKPLNVFLTGEEDARLGDLGIARVLAKDSSFARTLIGTPYYLSPELCSSLPYNEKSDVWAYGCVVYELCMLRRPFEATNTVTLMMKIVEAKYEPLDRCSDGLKKVVALCLERDMERRITCAALLELPDVQIWDTRLALVANEDAYGDGSSSPKEVHDTRRRAWKKWNALTKQITRLHNEVVKELDAPTREIWDNLYRLLRAKMVNEDLSSRDYADIERHIFEDLPSENTELIMKVTKILQLEAEASVHEDVLMNTR